MLLDRTKEGLLRILTGTSIHIDLKTACRLQMHAWYRRRAARGD